MYEDKQIKFNMIHFANANSSNNHDAKKTLIVIKLKNPHAHYVYVPRELIVKTFIFKFFYCNVFGAFKR